MLLRTPALAAAACSAVRLIVGVDSAWASIGTAPDFAALYASGAPLSAGATPAAAVAPAAAPAVAAAPPAPTWTAAPADGEPIGEQHGRPAQLTNSNAPPNSQTRPARPL
jgi:hypothetical protein